MWKEAWWYARARTNPDRPCPAVRSHPLAPRTAGTAQGRSAQAPLPAKLPRLPPPRRQQAPGLHSLALGRRKPSAGLLPRPADGKHRSGPLGASRLPFPPNFHPFPCRAGGKPRSGPLGTAPLPPASFPAPRAASPPPGRLAQAPLPAKLSPSLATQAANPRLRAARRKPPLLPADLSPLPSPRGRHVPAPRPSLSCAGLAKNLPAGLSPLPSRLGRQAPPWAARRKPPPLSAGLPPLPSPCGRHAPPWVARRKPPLLPADLPALPSPCGRHAPAPRPSLSCAGLAKKPFRHPPSPFPAAQAASPAPKPRCLDLDRTTQAASPSRLFPAPSPPRGHRAPVAWEKWGGRRKAYARSASFYPIAPVDHAAGPWFFHSWRHTDLFRRDFPRPRPLFRILAYPPSLLKARQTGNLSLAKVSNCGYNWVKQVESAFLFILQVRSVLWL